MMNIKRRLAGIAGAVVALLLAVSCGNMLEPPRMEDVPGEKGRLAVGMGDGRAIFPEGNLDTDKEVTFELTGIPSGGESRGIGSWGADETQTAYQRMVADTSLEVDRGQWEFTLSAKKAGVLMASATTKLEVKGGQVNKLNFGTMAYDTSGTNNGTVSLTLSFPKDNRVYKAVVELYSAEDDAPVSGSTKTLYTSSFTTTEENTYSIAYTYITKPGSYRVKVQLSSADSSHPPIATYTELVQVASGLTSGASRSLENLDILNKVTLYYNGGAVRNGVTLSFPETYNGSQTVTFPTDAQMYKAGAKLLGWYDMDDTTQTPVWEVSGLTAAKTYYAKWEETYEAEVTDFAGAVKQYTTFTAAALSAITGGETLKLLRDVSTSSTVSVSKNMNLDLNGHTIASSATDAAVTVNSNTTLNIKDSSEGQTGTIMGTGPSNIARSGIKVNSSTGTLIVNGGRIVSGDTSVNTMGVFNSSTGTVTINGGTIQGGKSTAGTSYGVYNYSTGAVTINGGTIRGGESDAKDSYGLYNYSTGAVTLSGSPVIVGGTAEAGSSTSIYPSGAPLTLDKDFAPAAGNTYSVLLGTVGVPSTGIFAKPGEGAALKAEWFTLSPAYGETTWKIAADTSGNLRVRGDDIATVTGSDSAVVGSYDNIVEAVAAAAASDGSTLKLTADVTTDKIITVSSGSFTLDLNGKAIISSAATIVKTSGSATLTVADNSTERTGAIKPASGDTVNSAGSVGINHASTGKLTISGGSITAAASSDGNIYSVWNNSSGIVEITGGTIVGSTSPDESAGVMNEGSGSVIISGGSIVAGASTGASSLGVWNYGNGSVTITGGTIQGGESTANGSYGVYNQNKGTVSLSGSPTITGSSTSIRLGSSASSLTLDKDFAPAAGTTYTVVRGTAAAPVTGMLAKPGEGATLKPEWFTLFDAYDDTYSISLESTGELRIKGEILATVTASGGGEVGSYDNFTDAVTAAKNSVGSTLKLTKDVVLGTSKYTISTAHNFTLDLNGKTINSTTSEVFSVSGTLVIDDTSDANNFWLSRFG